MITNQISQDQHNAPFNDIIQQYPVDIAKFIQPNLFNSKFHFFHTYGAQITRKTATNLSARFKPPS